VNSSKSIVVWDIRNPMNLAEHCDMQVLIDILFDGHSKNFDALFVKHVCAQRRSGPVRYLVVFALTKLLVRTWQNLQTTDSTKSFSMQFVGEPDSKWHVPFQIRRVLSHVTLSPLFGSSITDGPNYLSRIKDPSSLDMSLQPTLDKVDVFNISLILKAHGSRVEPNEREAA
jgi:hypothetical protein